MADIQDQNVQRIDRYLDELLTEDELRQFNADLLADAKLREQLVWASLQGGLLDERLAAVSVDQLPGASRTLSMRLTAWGMRLGAIAAMVVVAIVAWSLLLPSVKPGAAEASPANLPIAVITQSRGAQWLASDLPTDVGQPLPPGLLRLAAGMAQIEFVSGATAILEGPAEFRLISPTQGFLKRGKLHAHVPPPAQGFKVQSPSGETADVGADFSVNVDAAGHSDVHVYTEADLADAAPQRLRKLIEDSGQERYQAWLAYSKTLAKDPSLLLDFTFDAADPWKRAVSNMAESASSRGVGEGAIVGCQWMQGRWPTKASLEFKRMTDRVRIVVPGQFESMTFAAWIRIDGFDRKWTSLMLTDDWDAGEPHWQISQEGEMILGIRSEPYTNFYSPPVLSAMDLGRWVHVATVYNGAAGRVTHYLDGRPVSSEAITHPTKLRIGAAEIGNWRGFAGRVPAGTSLRNLNGRIDEMQLFSRPLSAAEITQLFEAGKP